MLHRRQFQRADACYACAQSYFKLVRNYFRQETRREWYDFRSSMFDALCESYARNLSGLQDDLAIATETRERLEDNLPDLRARAEELKLQLEKERARQTLLEGSDKEHLKELREGIAEQK